MSCEKCKSITLFSGNDGIDGKDGINGTNGQYGGWSSEWLFDTGTGTGTGAKDFRFDSGTLASVGTLYINDLNSNATDLSPFVAAWSNSGNYGLLRVSQKDDANIFWMGVVTSVTDLVSEYSIKATHVVSNGTFSDSESYILSFVSSGNPGTDAIDGINGTDGAYGGWSSEWEYDSSNASGTGSGEIRFDNGSLASVTGMYINDVNSDVANMEAFLDAFDNNGNFGLIRVSKKSNPAVFWMGAVTAETDSGSEHDITVTYTTHSGTFNDGDAVIVSFVNNGTAASPTYDSYTAQLTQTSTNAPVATYTLENTIGAVGFTYTSAGKYKITSAGLFTAGKTFASISADAQGSTVNTIMIHWVSTSEIWVHTYNITGATYADAILNNTSVEIRVYA